MTPTTDQIKALRAEAATHGDYGMVLICRVALGTMLYVATDAIAPELEALGCTSQEEALEACARAIEAKE